MFLTFNRTSFLCWVVENAGVANYLRDAERSIFNITKQTQGVCLTMKTLFNYNTSLNIVW